ncbi:hypothetical protein JCM10207_008729 [Rhodosporidiobolus poonsookiae]
MRSLTLLDCNFASLDNSTSPAATLAATTTDPATDSAYAVILSQPEGADGEATLEIYRCDPPPQPAAPRPTPELLTLFTTSPVPPTLASSPSFPFVVSFKYLPEDDTLVLVLANGEVEQIFLQGEMGEARCENVGTFDSGIKAAEWSPDEELLAIVTGDDLLLLLTRTFDPLSESPLHTSTFGTDAPVSVGWGAKSTQFHGSLGKAAAQAAARAHPLDVDWLLSPLDDRATRIAWRGDSAWFAVSSVEAAPPRTDRPDEGEREVRRVRIYSRTGEQSSTSEPVPGLEGPLAWVPSGEIIAGSQRKVVPRPEAEEDVELWVVFFERNGLRRHEFRLREDPARVKAGGVRVRELGWNAGSDVLAVWLERNGERGVEYVVQLWHRSNYYWYLKQELSPRLSQTGSLRAFVWHPEKALELSLLTDDGVEDYSLSWDTFASSRPAPFDDGTVAVTDGASTKLTPFRLINIPPPMSALTLSSSHSTPPTHIAFSASLPPSPSTSSAPPLLFALLYPSGAVQLFSWTLPLPASPREAQGIAQAGLPPPVLEWEWAGHVAGVEAGSGSVVRQCAVVGVEAGAATVAVLRSSRDGGDEVVVLGKEGVARRVGVMEGARAIVAAQKVGEEEQEGFVLQTAEGEVLEISLATTSDDFALPSSSLAPFSEFCPQMQHLLLPSVLPSGSPLPALIGLAPSGRLYASSRLLASDATSFALTADFLIYTTFSHEAKFVPLAALLPNGATFEAAHSESYARRAAGGAGGEGTSIKRAVERGSRIVAVVPSATNLVLQMPRGNLETVCPRPLVLRVVRAFLESHRYRAAFLLCRRHRIDLNILHDHSPSAFRTNLHEFVSQIKDVDHLNLFLSGLKDEDVTRTMYRAVVAASGMGEAFDASNKVNTVCDLVRADLEQRDVFHYANSILTAHVRKRPPAYEDALKVLVELKAKDPERAEDAVKYIIFLSDANKLFDLALGMYDFPLVLMIAQHSQKDPREYLPFLRALRSLPHFLQRHKIDDHLGRHASALRNLAQAGEAHFDDALEYAKTHGLYEVALEAYQGFGGRYEAVLCASAEHLFETSKYAEAGLLFRLGGQPDKALLAYQRARAWQELFALALWTGVAEEDVKELAVEVAESLTGKRRYAEAARVLLEYGKDVEAAVQALCEGNLYSEAVRVVALHSRSDLLDSIVKPATLDQQQRLVDDFDDLTEKIEKQLSRLDELKAKCEQNPYNYYCIDDPTAALENVELAPDGMSDAGTAFTRYTVAPTTMASSTRHSSKTAGSRRRQALKKAAGKKGSVYEEMYLLNSIKKNAEVKLDELQTDVAALLPILLTLSSSSHRSAAIDLQSALTTFETFLSTTLDTIWTPREAAWRAERAEEQRVRDTGDPLRIVEWEARPRPVEGEEETKRVERPALAKAKWRLGVLDAAARSGGA